MNEDDSNELDRHLSKAMTTMRKVWQVRTTVVRGWSRRGKRNAYLKMIFFIFMVIFYSYFYSFHIFVLLVVNENNCRQRVEKPQKEKKCIHAVFFYI